MSKKEWLNPELMNLGLEETKNEAETLDAKFCNYCGAQLSNRPKDFEVEDASDFSFKKHHPQCPNYGIDLPVAGEEDGNPIPTFS